MATPILVLVRSHQQENMFGRYTGEMLKLDGINSFDIVDMDTTEDWLAGDPSVVILTRCRLRNPEQDRLLEYVREGGRLIVFRPSYRLGNALGLTAKFTVTHGAYLLPDADHPVSRGLPHEPIQCHWPTEHWGLGSLPGGAEVIAHDYADVSSASGLPAIVSFGLGNGEVALCFYDPPAAVARLRFGNPDLASINTMGFPYYGRTGDLFTNYFDLSRGHLPQADLHCNLLSNLVSHLSAEPICRLWYYRTPEQRSALPMRSDDDWSTPDQFHALCSAVEQHNGHCTFYLVRDTKLPDSEVAAWLERGHNFGYHSNPMTDEDPYFAMEDTLRSDAENFRNRYGFTPRTMQSHCGFWRGYMDLVPVLHDIGIRMAVSYSCLLETYGKYMCGSSRPMKFVNEHGRIVDVYGQATLIYDDASIQDMLTNEVDTELAKVAKTLDYAVSVTYSPFGFQSHPVSFATYSAAYICGCMDLAKERGVPVLSMDEWLELTQSRYEAQLTVTSAGEDALECELTAGQVAGPLTVAVPVPDGKQAVGAAVDGHAIEPTPRAILGPQYALVPVQLSSAGESRRVRVEFAGR